MKSLLMVQFATLARVVYNKQNGFVCFRRTVQSCCFLCLFVRTELHLSKLY